MCLLETVLPVTKGKSAVGRRQQFGAESAIELHSGFLDGKWG